MQVQVFSENLMSISAYIEHQRYDSDLTLEILKDEKDHILPFIVLERLSSVIVSLSFIVLCTSPATFSVLNAKLNNNLGFGSYGLASRSFYRFNEGNIRDIVGTIQ